MNKGLLSKDGIESRQAQGFSNNYAKELLFTPPYVHRAFDLLAEKINSYIEYPTTLIDEGVEGIASVDLFFDEQGNVDEQRSLFFGDNYYVRGLLVHATRQGLVKWYLSDATRLQKDQFKNQYLRVEFMISHLLRSKSRVEKISADSYHFLRRHHKNMCAAATGIDVSCVAIKAYNSLRKDFDSGYNLSAHSLKEKLKYHDEMGLRGINDIIRGS